MAVCCYRVFVWYTCIGRIDRTILVSFVVFNAKGAYWFWTKSQYSIHL